jgi:hypothetical protein
MFLKLLIFTVESCASEVADNRNAIKKPLSFFTTDRCLPRVDLMVISVSVARALFLKNTDFPATAAVIHN